MNDLTTAREQRGACHRNDRRSRQQQGDVRPRGGDRPGVDDLVAGVDDAQVSGEFQEWLDIQSRFHDYSYRNTLLIKRRCPEATRVAGYRTWQEEFDRHVTEGESAIWIWAPIITKQCRNARTRRATTGTTTVRTTRHRPRSGPRPGRVQTRAGIRCLPD